MPKIIKRGNILSAPSGYIVHGCNAMGVMGSGLAKAIRERFPNAYSCYRKLYLDSIGQGKNLEVGSVQFVHVAQPEEPTKIVVNAITQQYYGREPDRQYVSYEAIESVFTQVASAAAWTGLDINYPQIGAGLGGGDWDVIDKIIDDVFDKFPKCINRTLWVKD